LVRAFNEELSDKEFFLRNKKNPGGMVLSINGGPLKDNDGKTIGSIIICSDITEKKKSERVVLEDIKLLRETLSKSELHNHEISMLSNLVESLQACLTVEEVAKTSAAILHSIFPETSGRLLVINNSKTEVQSVSDFGDSVSCKPAFPPEECWALRRSQAHLVTGEETSLFCQHLQEPFPKEYVCVPLAAQSKLVGMIHVSSGISGKIDGREKKLAVLIGEQIALALANLRLRETLKNQSIRDVVTGLFNRRYLEETLEKEIGRIERSNRKLAVLMIDIDHFKQFNDKFGHDSGDRILLEVGALLNKSIRKGDTAFRYGGEEMVILFPETGLDEAKRLAEKIRELVKALKVSHLNTNLGLVTVSIGVALIPDNGKTGLEVLKTADLALYQAKHTGRDRVVCSNEISSLNDDEAPILEEKVK
jgi:diguanylate cyclase (GGDEF)-like protein